MSNTEFIDLSQLYANMQQEMLQKLQTGSSAFLHPGTIGDTTEINWIQWFRNYLPKRYNVDKGIVIDSNGHQSQQIDLIIYDTQYSYLIFRQENMLLIPAESVYAVFEIKQELKKDTIEYAGQKAGSVRKLYRTTTSVRHIDGKSQPKPLHVIVAGILTTRSTWSAPITEKVVQYTKALPKNEHLDFICSISNNTFVISNDIFVNTNKSSEKPTISFCEKEESLVFLLLNLLKRLQDIGTVPAIDFSSYARTLNTKIYIDTP